MSLSLRLRKRLRQLLFLCGFFAIGASADTVQWMQEQFPSHNLYSPSLLWDLEEGKCKMWYHGWSIPGQQNDAIYYRETSGNCWFGEGGDLHIPIYTIDDFAAQTGLSITHVGDPSVAKDWNSVTGAWQYTMFFTVCRHDCSIQLYNEIWSVVSHDGVNWILPIRLVTPDGSVSGFAQPSVVSVSSGQHPYQVWAVFFESRHDSEILQIFYVPVDGNRNAIANKLSVFTDTNSPAEVISAAEVKYMGGKWHLWYNRFVSSNGELRSNNIHKKESYNYTDFGIGGDELLIVNPTAGPSICATTTPGVLVHWPWEYSLYFGSVTRQSGTTCVLEQHSMMHRWLWTD